ncbi:type I polyketide synthase [Kutzneria sp. CA-103260]|uniref:type I polyketide synthase n=1 Tax=Kutzneria sp. CA-103260 TaxID=2802641 RepID=UPI001BA569CF|nr:beta-ketoacyl synthase N-terminal-like domain-containing protein [Kutzneria sp. CA-103260]QUQ64643.1 non-ribosomal peptide synthetase/polyketide synthase [Kutzneria sp. CA-103260]
MTDIAVVGLAGRFPGASDVWDYWANLVAGRVTTSRLSRTSLLAAGLAESEVDDPCYVPVRGLLDGAGHFDADFFGITPKDAAIMDPQHRLLLQTAWEALESAGLATDAPFGRVATFAGAGFGYYLVDRVLRDPDLMREQGLLAAVLGNEKDHLAAKVAYRLDLTGPAITVQTACSTSLVAVHLAAQSLRSDDSDVALAGGVCVPYPQQTGYRHEPGGIMSPDGGCRPFDATAAGTVPGSGVGVVVLKRLADAVRDDDLIYAVVKGSAINNDGTTKVGYTAPGLPGQVDVLTAAYANAGVSPSTVDYVEAHGTATDMGDAIELAALTEVFAGRSAPCSLGSVKANIGHLDAAAGVAGFIKAVLALHFEQIPPMAGLTAPRAEIADGPFVLDDTSRKWTAGLPRRAAVSSFGLGGTNAHVVLEEAPARATVSPPTAIRATSTHVPHAPAVLTVSARTPAELATASSRLATHLRSADDISVHDVARTLQSHRRHFPHRLSVTAWDLAEAVDQLGQPLRQQARRRPSVVLLFPGQGSETPGMSALPYAQHPTFRSDVDECAELLAPLLGFDIRDVLLDPAADHIHRTDIAQPALVVHEYALGRLLLSWGIRPKALLGHSVGELAAACLAGELSLAQTLSLVARRGSLMQATAPGRMVAALITPAAAAELAPGIDIAAINGPDNLVLAGSEPAISALLERLTDRGIRHRQLPAHRAFHSRLMADAALQLSALPWQHRPRTQAIISSLDGQLLPRGGTRPSDYWATQLRSPVRFHDAALTALANSGPVFVEVGPGKALTSAIRHLPEAHAAATITLQSTVDEPVVTAAGRLWAVGATLDWSVVRSHTGRRVHLPTYPFARNEYWLATPTPNRVTPAPAGAPQEDTMLGRIIAVWTDLLGVPDLRADSDFFALGGESLLFLRMIARVRRQLGVDLDVDALSGAPTPSTIAAAVAAAQERE